MSIQVNRAIQPERERHPITSGAGEWSDGFYGDRERFDFMSAGQPERKLRILESPRSVLYRASGPPNYVCGYPLPVDVSRRQLIYPLPHPTGEIDVTIEL